MSCTFSSTDNTSAMGWTHKSSFSDTVQEPHIKISRKLADASMKHDFGLCSQHLAGWMNVVTDCLSRDFHLDDKFLTYLLLFFYPTQMPPSFRISPLPQEIISFVIVTLEVSLIPPRARHLPQRGMIAVGACGVCLPRRLSLEMCHSLIQSYLGTNLFSSIPLPVRLEQESLAERLSQSYFEARSRRPWTK